jgi:hypothetical protein
MKILTFIIEPTVIHQILDHLDANNRQRAPPQSTTPP